MSPTPSKTIGLANWLESYAETLWGIADSEKDKHEARRMLACSAELRRYERMKIRFRDQLKPLRKPDAPARQDGEGT